MEALESRVVEVTVGAKAENGLCQFMVSCQVHRTTDHKARLGGRHDCGS